MLVCLLTSCATTKVIPPAEMGFKADELSGTFVKVEAGGTIYSNSELSFACRFAHNNNYTYVIDLGTNSNLYVSGTKTTTDINTNYYHNGSSTKATSTTSLVYSYSGLGRYYCFSDEDEYNDFLENRIPIYKAEDYYLKSYTNDAVAGVVIGVCAGAIIWLITAI